MLPHQVLFGTDFPVDFDTDCVLSNAASRTTAALTRCHKALALVLFTKPEDYYKELVVIFLNGGSATVYNFYCKKTQTPPGPRTVMRETPFWFGAHLLGVTADPDPPAEEDNIIDESTK